MWFVVWYGYLSYLLWVFFGDVDMGEFKGVMIVMVMRMLFGYFGLKVRVRVVGLYLFYNKRVWSVFKGFFFIFYRKGGKVRSF